MTASDPTKLKAVKNIGVPGICFGMARVPNSSRLFFGNSEAKVYEIDLAAEKPEPIAFAGQHESYVMGVALAGPTLVTGAYDGKLIWWDTTTREKIRTVDAHAKWIRGVVASRDGKLISSVSDDMTCKLWNADTGELVHTLAGHQPLTPHHYPSMLFASTFSADGKLLATADKVGHVVVWDVAAGKQIAAVETPLMYTWDPKQRRHSIGGVRSVAFSADGQQLAIGGTGQIGNIDHLEALARIEIFDWQANKQIHEHAGDKYKGLVEQMAFHPQGEWLASVGGDHGGFIKFLDRAGKVLHQDAAPMHVYDFEFNETFDTMYAVGHGRLVQWELKAEAPAAETKPAAS